MDIGRMAVLDAGWDVEAPGVSLNRFCGSGQQAANFAAMGVVSGHQDLVVAGGIESMSRLAPSRLGLHAGNSHLLERHPIVPQGIAADLLATLEKIDRQTVDAFAVESQRRAALAQDEGRFDRSIVPIRHLDGTLALDRDEHPRPGTTRDDLAGLRPSFAELGTRALDGFDQSFDDMCRSVYPGVGRIDHVHHAGNSSGVVDGASAMLVASDEAVAAHGLRPRARLLMSAVVGAEPVVMLSAPAPASRRCLERAGMQIDDIDLWEINEAFAVVPIKTMRDLDLDPERVNVNGGAIALGHPIGASGVMLIETALDELERRDLTTALVTMCTGGGMATASIIERV